MNISDSLAELNLERFKVHSTKDAIFKPAAFLFSGDIINGLEIRTFSSKNLNFESKLKSSFLFFIWFAQTIR